MRAYARDFIFLDLIKADLAACLVCLHFLCPLAAFYRVCGYFISRGGKNA